MTENSISGNSPVGDAMTGSDEWLARLNAAIGTLGRDDFEDRLFALVNGAVRVDHCAVFIHNRDGTTAHLFTKSMLDAATCQNLTQAYTEQFHARDPNLTGAPATEDARVTLLPHTPTSAYDAEYQARFFEATGLIDKMSSLLRRREYTIYCRDIVRRRSRWNSRSPSRPYIHTARGRMPSSAFHRKMNCSACVWKCCRAGDRGAHQSY